MPRARDVEPRESTRPGKQRDHDAGKPRSIFSNMLRRMAAGAPAGARLTEQNLAKIDARSETFRRPLSVCYPASRASHDGLPSDVPVFRSADFDSPAMATTWDPYREASFARMPSPVSSSAESDPPPPAWASFAPTRWEPYQIAPSPWLAAPLADSRLSLDDPARNISPPPEAATAPAAGPPSSSAHPPVDIAIHNLHAVGSGTSRCVRALPVAGLLAHMMAVVAERRLVLHSVAATTRSIILVLEDGGSSDSDSSFATLVTAVTNPPPADDDDDDDGEHGGIAIRKPYETHVLVQ